ncbi:MAG: DUF86 domain-containing protein [Cyanobacteriota bacterium]|jgi:uncharacterized protein with HEPN domain
MSRREWSLFVADTRTVDAVVNNLLVISEEARCLPASIKQNHPDIDWIAINGLRNQLAAWLDAKG